MVAPKSISLYAMSMASLFSLNVAQDVSADEETTTYIVYGQQTIYVDAVPDTSTIANAPPPLPATSSVVKVSSAAVPISTLAVATSSSAVIATSPNAPPAAASTVAPSVPAQVTSMPPITAVPQVSEVPTGPIQSGDQNVTTGVPTIDQVNGASGFSMNMGSLVSISVAGLLAAALL